MTTDIIREAFETWAGHPDRHGKLPIDAHANGAYKDPRTYAAYYGWVSAWKASKKAAIELAILECQKVAEDTELVLGASPDYLEGRTMGAGICGNRVMRLIITGNTE